MHKEYREFVARLLLRPDWQIALLAGLLLLVIVASGYWLTLSALIQSAAATQLQAMTLQEKIYQQQRALLRQRPRAEWQAALDLIEPPQTAILPLPQQLLEPLNAVGGKLLHWLPASKTSGTKSLPDDLQQQGTFKLQLPYHGLVKLLEGAMTQSTVPLVIEQLSLARANLSKVIGGSTSLLDVTLQLASYRGNVTPVQRKQALAQFARPIVRDPFIVEKQLSQDCDPLADPRGLPELRGVLGDARSYTGWLRLATGSWLRAKTGETLADGQGYVDEVSNKQVRVSIDRPGCDVRQQTFTLAGL